MSLYLLETASFSSLDLMDPQSTSGNTYANETRAQCLALKAFGATNKQITAHTGIKERQIRNYVAKAKERGWEPGRPVLHHHVADGTRPGRPRKVTPEVEAELVRIVTQSRKSRYFNLLTICRELSNSYLAVTLAPSTVAATLRRLGFRKVKPTTKPGLNDTQMKARLDWCHAHRSWTIEDWKRVIWTDETSVVFGQRRGAQRVWRRPYEVNNKQCIRRRWKGFSDFMFWGSFCYDLKGPCHIYKAETKKEKEAAQREIDQMNEEQEPIARAQFEAEMKSRNKQGRQPRFQFTEARGKLKRSARGGIDWYRHRKEVVIAKLIPFAKQCEIKLNRKMIVQEDGARPHIHWIHESLWILHQLQRFAWPGNSPDLNAIEPSWIRLKKASQLHRMFESRPWLRKIWLEAWDALPQEQIQRWIKRIPRAIEYIIHRNGGNDYSEGGWQKDAWEHNFDWRSTRAEFLSREEQWIGSTRWLLDIVSD